MQNYLRLATNSLPFTRILRQDDKDPVNSKPQYCWVFVRLFFLIIYIMLSNKLCKTHLLQFDSRIRNTHFSTLLSLLESRKEFMITYFSGFIRKKKHSTAIALLFAIAICFAVAWLVFLATNNNLAANLKDKNLDMYCLAAFILFSVAGTFIAITKKIKINIYQDSNGSLCIDVQDPELGSPLLIHNPASITKQWTLIDLGRRNKIKMLYVTLCDTQGNAIITFTGALGNFYDAPDGFEHTSPNQIITAEHIYDTGRIQDITHAFWCHEDYLALKNKKASRS